MTDLDAQPDWYLALTRRPDDSQATTPSTGETISIADPAAYTQAALDRIIEDFTAAPEGTRNPELNRAAFAAGRLIAGGLPLTAIHVIERLEAACQANGLASDDGLRACRNTIRSGIQGGARNPLHWTQQTRPAPNGTGGVFGAVPGDTTTPAQPAQPTDDALLAEEVTRQRRNRKARRVVDTEEAAHTYVRVPFKTVTQLLAEPDPPITWAIEGLLQVGSNALLTARYKTGKTTTLLDLARSIADGVSFLGAFKVAPDLGRIAILDYELDENLHRRWIRDIGIRNTDRVVVRNTRGYRAPFSHDQAVEDLITDLKHHEVGVAVIDPFARAAIGVDENDNMAVGAFLDLIDYIKRESGTHTLVLATHTGRRETELGHERARGATRLDDWPDVRWLLTRDDDDEQTRYFGADGRDVTVDLGALNFDPTTRRLTFTGKTPTVVKAQTTEDAVLTFVKANTGCSGNAVEKSVTGGGTAIRKALKALVAGNYLAVDEDGPRGANTYTFLRERTGSVFDK